MTRVQMLEAELREARAEEAREAFAARKCRACGERDDSNGGSNGYLTDFTITIAQSEEGYSHIDSQLCSVCLEKVTEALAGVGVAMHAHGGICFLEDLACPGASDPQDCPTPEPQYAD